MTFMINVGGAARNRCLDVFITLCQLQIMLRQYDNLMNNNEPCIAISMLDGFSLRYTTVAIYHIGCKWRFASNLSIIARPGIAHVHN